MDGPGDRARCKDSCSPYRDLRLCGNAVLNEERVSGAPTVRRKSHTFDVHFANCSTTSVGDMVEVLAESTSDITATAAVVATFLTERLGHFVR